MKHESQLPDRPTGRRGAKPGGGSEDASSATRPRWRRHRRRLAARLAARRGAQLLLDRRHQRGEQGGRPVGVTQGLGGRRPAHVWVERARHRRGHHRPWRPARDRPGRGRKPSTGPLLRGIGRVVAIGDRVRQAAAIPRLAGPARRPARAGGCPALAIGSLAAAPVGRARQSSAAARNPAGCAHHGDGRSAYGRRRREEDPVQILTRQGTVIATTVRSLRIGQELDGHRRTIARPRRSTSDP